MPKTQFRETRSAEQVLQVGAYAAAFNFFWVNPLVQTPWGAIWSVGEIVNSGDLAETFYVDFYMSPRGVDAYGYLTRTGDLFLVPGQTAGIGVELGTIHEVDVTVLAILRRFDGTEMARAYADVDVTLQVNTTLTLDINPKAIPIDGVFRASGNLTRNDNGTGVSSGLIWLYVYINGEWRLWATGITTDVNGNYTTWELPGPDTVGKYGVYAYYPGSGVFAAAMSSEGVLTVGAVEAIMTWWNSLTALQKALVIVGVGTMSAVGVGVGLAGSKRKKKEK